MWFTCFIWLNLSDTSVITCIILLDRDNDWLYQEPSCVVISDYLIVFGCSRSRQFGLVISDWLLQGGKSCHVMGLVIYCS